MSKLKEYQKSKVNRIKIQYGKETFEFNLFEELKINETIIDRELKEQPSHYGFILLLQKKLTTRFEDLKLERKKIWGELTIKAKSKMQQNTQRPYTDDMCKAWVESHKLYILASQNCIRAKDDADSIFACVKAFEQRKDLLQTISSNRRKESFN